MASFCRQWFQFRGVSLFPTVNWVEIMQKNVHINCMKALYTYRNSLGGGGWAWVGFCSPNNKAFLESWPISVIYKLTTVLQRIFLYRLNHIYIMCMWQDLPGNWGSCLTGTRQIAAVIRPDLSPIFNNAPTSVVWNKTHGILFETDNVSQCRDHCMLDTFWTVCYQQLHESNIRVEQLKDNLG